MFKKLFQLLLLLIMSVSARASVVLTDLSPDSTAIVFSAASSWFGIDLNSDGTTDYNFSWTAYGGRFSPSLIYCYGPATNELSVLSAGSITLSVIDSATLIDAGHNWSSAGSPGGDVTPDFTDAGDKFIGVRFKAGTSTYYGWIHISYTSSNLLTVMSYAYETTAGTGIYTPSSSPSVLKPGANFTTTATITDTKTTMTFTDISSNTPTAWQWTFTPATVTFMGGTNATSQHPQVQFTGTGKYTVKLKATNAGGSDSTTKTDYMVVENKPLANFNASTASTDTKTTVTLTDLSANTPTAWQWTFTPATVTFMGGTNATSKNPQVRFGSVGKYTVKLKVTNISGNDSLTKTDYITVTEKPSGISNYTGNSAQVNMFPNPASKILTIECPDEKGTITILDIAGKTEWTGAINDKNMQLDISGLPKGQHILRITSDKEVVSSKLIIQ